MFMRSMKALKPLDYYNRHKRLIAKKNKLIHFIFIWRGNYFV